MRTTLNIEETLIDRASKLTGIKEKTALVNIALVLVDTSVWVSHLRKGNEEIKALLNNGDVMCHPFIVGELACGNIKNRTEILSLLQSLPMAIQVENEELLHFIETHSLMGKGLGYVDVQLSASALLSGVPIWTLDKSLAKISERLNISYSRT
jgi:predicted nucleic acid-binding protein